MTDPIDVVEHEVAKMVAAHDALHARYTQLVTAARRVLAAWDANDDDAISPIIAVALALLRTEVDRAPR